MAQVTRSTRACPCPSRARVAGGDMSCGMLIRRADEIVAFSSAADLMQGCF